MTRQPHSKAQQLRRIAKQASKRREHADRYADKTMEDKLRRLAERFNGTERDDERR